MEITELSLAPSYSNNNICNSSSSESENNVSSSSSSSKKRKYFSEHQLNNRSNNNNNHGVQTSVDLHVKDPLPLDWEQCLDLQSGKMYYLNRKTSRKSMEWPKDQKLDLQLNISPFNDPHPHRQQCITSSYSSSTKHHHHRHDHHDHDYRNHDHHDHDYRNHDHHDHDYRNHDHQSSTSTDNNNNMVALACLNCHLLVILSRSSPSCPNCKYFHSLPTHNNQNPQPKISHPSTTTTTTTKPRNTLSLLN